MVKVNSLTKNVLLGVHNKISPFNFAGSHKPLQLVVVMVVSFHCCLFVIGCRQKIVTGTLNCHFVFRKWAFNASMSSSNGGSADIPKGN